MATKSSWPSQRAVVRQALFDVERAPRTHMMADLSKEKFSKHRIQLMVFEYDCACLSARKDANLLYVAVAAVPIPPAAEKTSGVNEPCSTSRILLS